MEKATIKNYDHLLNIDWFNQVSTIEVNLHEKGDNSKTTTYNFRLNEEQSVCDVLTEQKLIKDTDEVREQINSEINKHIKSIIQKRLNNYATAVDVHNMLVDLDVKDKRQWSCGEAYEGKIKWGDEVDSNFASHPSEESFVCPTENLCYFNPKAFVVRIACPYDYDWKADRYKHIYNKDKCVVNVNSFGVCDLELRLEFKSKDYKTGVRFNIPNPAIFYNLRQKDNTISKVSFIDVAISQNKYKPMGKGLTKTYKFQSYYVGNDSRSLSLNTFIVYCREKSDDNRKFFLQDVVESVNKEEMLKELKEKFGEENVFKTTAYHSDVNFKNMDSWGRYGAKVVKVILKDDSFLLYDYTEIKRNKKLELRGLWDSSYTKESVSDAFERVMNKNIEDKSLVSDMIETTFNNE